MRRNMQGTVRVTVRVPIQEPKALRTSRVTQQRQGGRVRDAKDSNKVPFPKKFRKPIYSLVGIGIAHETPIEQSVLTSLHTFLLE